jgi:hypothetical protein
MDVIAWARTSTLYRRVVRRLRASPLVVCEYNAWHRYTIQELRPDALRILLRPGETGNRVLRGVPHTARAMLMHLNASRTDGFISDANALWTSLRDRGVTLVNSEATDIRKRTIQERCEGLGLPSARAGREGPEGERLVVKTNLNYGGGPERDLVRTLKQRAVSFTGTLTATSIGSTHYMVCRRSDVPPSLWDDTALVIERFIENPDGVFFRVYVVGPATCVSEVWSDYDIKKLSLPVRARVNHFYWTADSGSVAATAPNETVARVVALTRQVCHVLGVDFGAADCVMGADGSLFVVDVNKTPYWGNDVRPDVIAHLRHGLDSFL